MNMQRISRRGRFAAVGAAIMAGAIFTGSVRAVGAPVQPQLDDAYRAAGIIGTYVTPRRNVKGAYGVALPVVLGLNDGEAARGRKTHTIDVSKYLPTRTPTAPGYPSHARPVGSIVVPG